MLDVAVVGGGPAGSTVGSLLKKYQPRLKIAIFERERFPRDHVGESQLPVIGKVLDEMGCWDKVEVAGFPIKIGATYRWGRTDDLWNFEFIPNGALQAESRPAQYAGQRLLTAFQVDRAIYDKILLDHARDLGCEVHQEARVVQVERERDKVQALLLDSGERVEARYYVDASGHSGIIRRAMGVAIDSPSRLQNVAIWDYWQNATWAETIGVGGTRVQVLSLGWGWIWFIPLGPTRTSIGLVVPASTLKQADQSAAKLYRDAIENDPVVSKLIRGATPEDRLTTTKDWSFLAERLCGENWFLAGESAGFADPILAAGMTLAHMGAREVAYTILELDRGQFEREWLLGRYDEGHRQKIGQHIRFADFWYSANGQFTDLQDYTREIAQGAGLDLDSEQAWQWLGAGGFVDHDTVGTGFGGYSLAAVKQISGNFLGERPRYAIDGMNVFELHLEGAEKSWGAILDQGRISRHRAFRRGGKYLPNTGLYGLLISQMRPRTTGSQLFEALFQVVRRGQMPRNQAQRMLLDAFNALESMVNDGWVTAERDPSLPAFQLPEEDDSVIRRTAMARAGP
jgi:flavin-dependent dehydrogenase